MEQYKENERRHFLRYDFEKPCRYSVIDSIEHKEASLIKILDAFSKNISASGILFTTKNAPKISSLLALDVDYRTLRICQEIEARILIVNNKLVGKVVRLEDNEDGLCGVGVAFVRKSDGIPQNIAQLIK